ncbi:hypothetical protein Taro_011509, partial [Colocasia esculenta]|nr:hypothetical protein [Colocasia esculenta]
RQTVSTFTALLTCLAVILIVGVVYYSCSWCLFRSILGEFPTEPVTREAHPYPHSALVVGGTDTSSRHWSPASPFPVPHSREPGPGSLEVPGMGL